MGFLFVGGWVDLVMRRYITLLLFIGMASGQDYYGIFGYRNYKLEKECTLATLACLFVCKAYN